MDVIGLAEVANHFRSFVRKALASKAALLAVAFPLLVRTIPELLAGPWPLGFDTVWIYAPFVKGVETRGLQLSLQDVLDAQSAPLMYVLLGLVAIATNAPPFVITKAAAPLLYGFLGFALYAFARRGLKWDPKKGLLLVIITTLYFVPLRLSWDMYKNTLGYSFFLLALSDLGRTSNLRTSYRLFTLTALCTLASELTAVLLGATALIFVLWRRFQARKWDYSSSIVAVVGGIALLFYGRILVQPSQLQSPLGPPPSPSGVLYDYVGSNLDVYVYAGVVDVYASVFSLSILIFAPVLWPAAVGRFVERRVVASSLVLMVGAFTVIINPYAAFPAWHRWLYMLVFPALTFATNGILRTRGKARAGLLVVFLVLGATFIVMPTDTALPYYSLPQTIRFIPPNLLRNTVGLEDSPNVVALVDWLDMQRIRNAVLVADIWFVGWGRLYADSLPVYEYIDSSQVDQANFSAYNRVFVLNWAPSEEGFSAQRLPMGIVPVLSIGRVALYEIMR